MPPAQNQSPMQSRHEDGAGPIVGAIIVVILLVFGALYFWGQQLNKQQNNGAPLVHVQVSGD